jgi:cytochrome c-type biogenesis protein
MSAEGFAGALAFAGGAGVTTFFAPCAFPLLPGYVGFYLRESERERPGLAAAGAAAVGSLGALALVAGLVFALGRQFTAALPVFEPVAGVVLVGFGALLAVDAVPEVSVALPRRPRTVVGFGLFGALYAVAAAGCVVPLFLGVVAQALSFSPARGVAVVAAYATAVSAPLVGVTLLASAGVDSWRAGSRYSQHATDVAAAILVLAGLGQVVLSVAVLDVV